jgi:hypothetical protein
MLQIHGYGNNALTFMLAEKVDAIFARKHSNAATQEDEFVMILRNSL